MTIQVRNDNLFDSDAQALVNAVNCVGVMGGGIALEFKNRYPDMYRVYRDHCNHGLIAPGVVVSHRVGNPGNATRWVLNFPTKDDWRDPSLLSYVIKGYTRLLDRVDVLGIKSVAIPALGCGLGGLEWDEVGPILYSLDEVMPQVTWMIYPPQ